MGLLLAPGVIWGEAQGQAGTPVVYRYEDFRLGSIGPSGGDIIAIPPEIEVDGSDVVLVLVRSRISTTKEADIPEKGRRAVKAGTAGQFKYEVVGVTPRGTVTALIDAGPGYPGEPGPFRGLVPVDGGIYLYGAGPGGLSRIRFYSGKKMKLAFNSSGPAGDRPDPAFTRHAQAISRVLDSRKRAVSGVSVGRSPRMNARNNAVEGWGGKYHEVDIGTDGNGNEYADGVCVGVDGMAAIYLLMTRIASDEDFGVRRAQDLVILSGRGERVAALELPPWRKDLWASGGGNIRVMNDGTVYQLWSNGTGVLVRRWTR